MDSSAAMCQCYECNARVSVSETLLNVIQQAPGAHVFGIPLTTATQTRFMHMLHGLYPGAFHVYFNICIDMFAPCKNGRGA